MISSHVKISMVLLISSLSPHLDSLVYYRNIFGSSSKVTFRHPDLQTSSEIFKKCSGTFVWPSEQFWYRVEHSKIEFISRCGHVISSISSRHRVISSVWPYHANRRIGSSPLFLNTRLVRLILVKHKFHDRSGSSEEAQHKQGGKHVDSTVSNA